MAPMLCQLECLLTKWNNCVLIETNFNSLQSPGTKIENQSS